MNKELEKNAACDLRTSLKGCRVTMELNRVTSHLSCTKEHSIDTVNRVLLYIQAKFTPHARNWPTTTTSRDKVIF